MFFLSDVFSSGCNAIIKFKTPLEGDKGLCFGYTLNPEEVGRLFESESYYILKEFLGYVKQDCAYDNNHNKIMTREDFNKYLYDLKKEYLKSSQNQEHIQPLLFSSKGSNNLNKVCIINSLDMNKAIKKGNAYPFLQKAAIYCQRSRLYGQDLNTGEVFFIESKDELSQYVNNIKEKYSKKKVAFLDEQDSEDSFKVKFPLLHKAVSSVASLSDQFDGYIRTSMVRNHSNYY